MYLERFDSHSSLVLLFHHFNQFGYDLVCNIVGVSATLKHNIIFKALSTVILKYLRKICPSMFTGQQHLMICFR